MILTDEDIRSACAKPDGEISISPFDPTAVRPVAVNLRVGSQAATWSSNELTDVARKGLVKVQPGDFVTVTTLETIRLDDGHVGRFGLTSSCAGRGLVAMAEPRIEPGFHGRLAIGLTNLSMKPVALALKDSFLSVEFHRLGAPRSSPHARRRQNRMEAGADDIRAIMKQDYMSQAEIERTLEALVSATYGLKRSVNVRLPLTLVAFLTLFSGIVAGVAASF